MLAEIWSREGMGAPARALARQALERLVEHHGPEHPRSIEARARLGAVMLADGDSELARQQLQAVVASSRLTYGPPITLDRRAPSGARQSLGASPRRARYAVASRARGRGGAALGG